MENAVAKLEEGKLLDKDEILLLSGDQIEDYIYAAKSKLRLSGEQLDFLKKYRRLIKNKEYAQQSRDKKKKYIFELESELNTAISSISKLQQDINNLSIKNAQLETENRSLHEELSIYRERWGIIRQDTLQSHNHNHPSAVAAPVPMSSSSSSSSSPLASNSPDAPSYVTAYARPSIGPSSSSVPSSGRGGFFMPMFAICLMGLCFGLLLGPFAEHVPGLSGIVGLHGNSTTGIFTNIKDTGRTLKSELIQQQSTFSSWLKSFFYGSDPYESKAAMKSEGQYGDDENKILPYSDMLIKGDLINGKPHETSKEPLTEVKEEDDEKDEQVTQDNEEDDQLRQQQQQQQTPLPSPSQPLHS